MCMIGTTDENTNIIFNNCPVESMRCLVLHVLVSFEWSIVLGFVLYARDRKQLDVGHMSMYLVKHASSASNHRLVSRLLCEYSVGDRDQHTLISTA